MDEIDKSDELTAGQIRAVEKDPFLPMRLAKSNIQVELDKIRAFELSKLLREDLESLSFVECKEVFERTFALLEGLSGAVFDNCPTDYSEEAQRRLSHMRQVFQAIMDFDAKQENAIHDSELLKKRLFDTWVALYFPVRQLALLTASEQSLTAVSERLNGAILKYQDTLKGGRIASDRLNEEIEASETERRLLNQQVDNGIKRIDKLITDLGIKGHAKRFRDEAWINHGLSAAFLLAGGWLTKIAFDYTFESERHIQYAFARHGFHGALIALSTRLIILSLYTFGIFFCARNFSAARHNATVNGHRQNALSTFEIFTTAQDADADTKKAVLLQAMVAIFTPQSSGYLKASEDNAPNTQTIIDLVKPGASTELK